MDNFILDFQVFLTVQNSVKLYNDPTYLTLWFCLNQMIWSKEFYTICFDNDWPENMDRYMINYWLLISYYMYQIAMIENDRDVAKNWPD